MQAIRIQRSVQIYGRGKNTSIIDLQVRIMKEYNYKSHVSIPSTTQHLSPYSQPIIRQSKPRESNTSTQGNPSREDFKKLFWEGENSSQGSHQRLIENLRNLDCDDLEKELQDYCIQEFHNLPLLMLYEIAKQFNLQHLNSKCQETLISDNYEQLNIKKYDLVKLSFPTFQKLLREYRVHANNLDIYGLKQSDLKSIVDDYCLNAAISQITKSKLYEEFVNCNNFIPANDSQKEVRRSMINLNKASTQHEHIKTPDRKMKKFQSVPALSNDQQMVIRVPQGLSQENSPTLALVKQQTRKQTKEIREMIEGIHERQNDLYSQIVGISKQCAKNPNKRIIKDGLRNLGEAIQKLQKQMGAQREKLRQISQNAKVLQKTSKSTKAESMDFVFKY